MSQGVLSSLSALTHLTHLALSGCTRVDVALLPQGRLRRAAGRAHAATLRALLQERGRRAGSSSGQ